MHLRHTHTVVAEHQPGAGCLLFGCTPLCPAAAAVRRCSASVPSRSCHDMMLTGCWKVSKRF